jgi:replicative DNA helicase
MRRNVWSEGAEQAVLGVLLITGGRDFLKCATLSGRDFFHPANGVVFEAIKNCCTSFRPADPPTVRVDLETSGDIAKLKSLGGAEYLERLVMAAGGSDQLVTFTERILEFSERRARREAAINFAAQAGKADCSGAELEQHWQSLVTVSRKRPTSQLRTLNELLREAERDVDGRQDRQTTALIRTGFQSFDWLTGGMEKTDFVLVAARPSMGKSAFAADMLASCAEQGIPSLFVSLEMGALSVVQRLIAGRGRIEVRRLRSDILSHGDRITFGAAIGKLGDLPMWITDNSGMKVEEICATVESWRAEQKSEHAIAVVDYVGLVKGMERDGKNREREVSEISLAFKTLAKRIGSPVVALSQLNRSVESRQDKRPVLSDLRDSGSLEQDADKIAFLYRDEYYNKSGEKDVCEVIVGKNRNGPTGTVKMKFERQFCKFSEITVTS